MLTRTSFPRVSSARISLLASVVALAACSDPAEGVAPATVGAPTTEPAPAQPPPAGTRQTLEIDRASSRVAFTGAKITATHDGSFTDFSGQIELDPENVTASSVRVTIQMASLQIEPERLAQHLVTPDFFDVAQFPTSTFTSTAIAEGATAQVGGRPATHTITGDLTMHGRTQRISFPAIVTVTADAVSAESEFSIDRRQFGIVYPGMPDDLIRDEVAIRLSVRAPRS